MNREHVRDPLWDETVALCAIEALVAVAMRAIRGKYPDVSDCDPLLSRSDYEQLGKYVLAYVAECRASMRERHRFRLEGERLRERLQQVAAEEVSK